MLDLTLPPCGDIPGSRPEEGTDERSNKKPLSPPDEAVDEKRPKIRTAAPGVTPVHEGHDRRCCCQEFPCEVAYRVVQPHEPEPREFGLCAASDVDGNEQCQSQCEMNRKHGGSHDDGATKWAIHVRSNVELRGWL